MWWRVSFHTSRNSWLGFCRNTLICLPIICLIHWLILFWLYKISSLLNKLLHFLRSTLTKSPRHTEMDPVEFVNNETDFTICYFDLTHMVKRKRLRNHLSQCSLNHLSQFPSSQDVTRCEICLDSFKTLEVEKHLLKDNWREKQPYKIITDITDIYSWFIN